jgi:hypothetical protein
MGKYSNFIKKLKSCIKEYFLKISEKEGENLYTFGISTNSDAEALLLAYNTYGYAEGCLAYYFDEFHQILNSIRWNINEWYSVSEKQDESKKLEDLLDEFEEIKENREDNLGQTHQNKNKGKKY